MIVHANGQIYDLTAFLDCIGKFDAADKRKLIDKLQAETIAELQAKAAADNKKMVIERIAAARSDEHNGGRNAIALVDGALRRANVEPIEQLAVKELHEINDILAAATKLSPVDRTLVRGILYRLGAIPQ
jgi:hypothetical protein